MAISNIQGVCGALDGAVTPSDDQDMIDLRNIQGVCGALDGAVNPPDDQDSAKLVKIVKIGPSGELDGTSTLSDGRDTTKTMKINLRNIQGVCASWDGAVTPPDDQDMIDLINIQGVCGALDRAVSPLDDQDSASPSGELDGTLTLPDGQDTTKTTDSKACN
ncbi:hypothetical protein Tco_1104637 [Tanacetum coccineum]